MNKNIGISVQDQEKITRLVKALLPNAKVYLYGSRARGDFSHGSDIDIALDTGVPMERITVGEVRDVLDATHIPHRFDVLDLNNIPQELRNNILKDAILWKN